MQEIQRALLLPPPSQRTAARPAQIDSDSAIEAARGTRRQAQAPAQAFLTLVESRREDTVEIKGKQFRFRPYGNRGTTDATRDTEPTERTGGTEAVVAESDDEISVDLLDRFGDGAQGRNSSQFLASLIAQERLRQGLYNPEYEAASDAYRRAGGSPSAVDNEARVFSVAV